MRKDGGKITDSDIIELDWGPVYVQFEEIEKQKLGI